VSVQAISWVIDHSKHKGNSFVVLLMIANHARPDGTGAWPSVSTLSKESRISERTVQRNIKRLTRTTFTIPPELVVEERKGPHGCNLYSIPGVKLSTPRCQTVVPGVSDTVTAPVSPVTPEPSFNRPSKKENPAITLRYKKDTIRTLQRILAEGKGLIPSERSRIRGLLAEAQAQL
jgi:hypothetical protein